MRTVLTDEALAERLSHAARRRAATFSWDRSAELMVAAYREVTT